MEEQFDIWQLAAGLGLFLYGMHQLEQSLVQLAGRSFKKFLKRSTDRPIKGMFAGALSTAALQSSSVVSLIVLAFVGAGVISLSSAIGIVFGSNLGTTATGWIVATVGFKLDIESLALPLIALGGFGVAWSTQGTRRASYSRLMAGFGLMLLGLSFMKDGSASATQLFDPEALAHYPAWVFLLVGFALTAIIQSSSATIMITLSALYAGVIPLPAAAAAAIGADLGTTITAILGALAGSANKRRVAFALILFNVVTDIIAFVSMIPLLRFIQEVLTISDPLLALVAFHSLFNFIGIVLFLPAVRPLSRALAHRLSDGQASLARYLNNKDSALPEVAIENFEREAIRVIDQATALNLLTFGLPVKDAFFGKPVDRKGVALFGSDPNHAEGYSQIKQLEGEILAFGLALQRQTLQPRDSERLSQIKLAVREAVHAAKTVKDTHHDLQMFRESVNDRFNAWFGRFADAAEQFHAQLCGLHDTDHPAAIFELLVELKSANEASHAALHADIYHEVEAGELTEQQISTLLNVNREHYSAHRSLLIALANVLLEPTAAADFEGLPAGH